MAGDDGLSVQVHAFSAGVGVALDDELGIGGADTDGVNANEYFVIGGLGNGNLLEGQMFVARSAKAQGLLSRRDLRIEIHFFFPQAHSGPRRLESPAKQAPALGLRELTGIQNTYYSTIRGGRLVKIVVLG